MLPLPLYLVLPCAAVPPAGKQCYLGKIVRRANCLLMPLSWRTATASEPPADLPLWYFMDHSDDPTVSPGTRLVKQWTDDGKMRPGVVWRATRHLQAGTVLTFNYGHPNEKWRRTTPESTTSSGAPPEHVSIAHQRCRR